MRYALSEELSGHKKRARLPQASASCIHKEPLLAADGSACDVADITTSNA
jgi:hypothetical protein